MLPYKYLHTKSFSTFSASCVDYSASIFCFHSYAKSMCAFLWGVVWLVCSFHYCVLCANLKLGILPKKYLKKGYLIPSSLLKSTIAWRFLSAFVMTRNSTLRDLSSFSNGLAKLKPFARKTSISQGFCESMLF